MRDLVVREALKTMADDASGRLRELVGEGHDIPYDVREAEVGSPLPQYIPLTERFIRDQAQALCALDSFGAACAAIDAADLAAPYLDGLGIDVPADDRKRAELAGIAFLCRLWAGSTDFSIDPGLLAESIAELEDGAEIGANEIEVIVPLRGMQMPLTRLELATATIVRADTVDVPGEARAAEGSGAAGWEPTFLAATRVSDADGDHGPSVDAGARAVEAFRQLITTLRLFKGGGVGLGPYAWTRVGSNRWRRIATGAGRPRPGGYRMSEDELSDLVIFSRALAYRSTAFGKPAKSGPGLAGALARAITRFEGGLERAAVIDALNDYLLALRFVLEGGGAAQLGLPIRVAALCAEPEHRGETKAIVDRAEGLERELWSGEPATAAEGAPTPAETAAVVEDLTRAILRDAACGHLGTDLRSTADEILLADGLAVGEGRAEQRGGAEEWDIAPDDIADAETRELSLAELEAALGDGQANGSVGSPAESVDELQPEPTGESVPEDPAPEEPSEVAAEQPEPAPAGQKTLWMDLPDDWQQVVERARSRQPMQVPEPEGRIRVESRPQQEEDTMFSRHSRTAPEAAVPAANDDTEVDRTRVAELLEERPRDHQKTAERVAYLFPRPETTEWSVREISYDRRRRAQVQQAS
jgi:hypothetical protein